MKRYTFWVVAIVTGLFGIRLGEVNNRTDDIAFLNMCAALILMWGFISYHNLWKSK